MRPKLVLPLAGLLLLGCVGSYPASDGHTPGARLATIEEGLVVYILLEGRLR
jgi:hypothetical protein